MPPETLAEPHRVVLIPGDGIGPEVTAAARRVLDATGVAIAWREARVGTTALATAGSALPEAVLADIRQAGVALKGPVATPIDGDFRSPNIELRQELDLYAQLRPFRTRRGIAGAQEVDVLLVREATQGLYRGIEFDAGDPATGDLLAWLGERGEAVAADSGVSLSPLSERAARRVMELAFRLAERQGRRLVTAAHKASVMRSTDGLFLRVAREVAAAHPDVQFDDVLIDRLALDLVRQPEAFDLLVMQNLYGDVFSDLAAGLTGGLGLAAGANLGDACAVFEPAHGVVAHRAGTGTANPLGAILCGALLLRHLDEPAAALAVERAVDAVVAEGRWLTPDLAPGRPARTSDVERAVVDVMGARIG